MRSCIIPGLPANLVQELNVGTVAPVNCTLEADDIFLFLCLYSLLSILFYFLIEKSIGFDFPCLMQLPA